MNNLAKELKNCKGNWKIFVPAAKTKPIIAKLKEVLEYQILGRVKDCKREGCYRYNRQSREHLVDDSNILAVLNELRAADVQALARTMKESSQPVRCAGRQLYDGKWKKTVHHIIKAIADPVKLENSLKIMYGVVDMMKYYDLKVEVKQEDNIIIPGVRDDGTVLRHDLLTPVE